MGKTRAEIQKAYRQRKKVKEGAAYLNRETERVKRYYKPTNKIGRRKLKARREKIRNCMRKKRLQARHVCGDIVIQQQQENNSAAINEHVILQSQCDDRSEGPCDSTTGICSSSQPDETVPSTSALPPSSRLLVNFKFKERRGSWKKSKALKNARDEVKVLNERVKSLKKRNETLKKRLQRRSVVTSPEGDNLAEMSKSTGKSPNRKRKYQDLTNMTPKSRSQADLRNEGISPSKHQRLVKKLTFHNTIIQEVREKIKPDRGRSRQRSSLQIICGRVLKKYRLGSSCSRELGVNRGQILKSETRKSITKGRKVFERTHVKVAVVSFLERDDNSACLPGKRDASKGKEGVTQIRVLNDYLYNLHLKFESENPSLKTSLTTFSSYRPKYIKLVKYSSRRTCLCQKHQNIALKVKGLKSVGATNTDSPDMLIRQSTDEQILQRIADCEAETIKFSEWKRKDVNHKGKVMKRMMIESVELPTAEFTEMFRKDLITFRKHVYRVKCQYEQVKKLKEKLPQKHAICQMDFAENYSCGHAEEIQTAYFDKCSVTLHPVVVYTKDQDGITSHMSYIYVSDTQAHNSGTVFAFMKRITDDLKSRRPDIDCVHYVTDSPTSQYRNKTMMYVVANHDHIFGISASWQYWEAGHGKGPCDGVGGTSKRQADMAVKRHSVVIQSSLDYFNWGRSQTGSQTKYYFVSKEECDNAQKELSVLNIKPVKGTMDIHSVVQVSTGEIAVRNTSCFCDGCFQNGRFTLSCNGWVKHSLNHKTDKETDFDLPTEPSHTTIEPVPEQVTTGSSALPDDALTVSVNDFVAAVYNDRWYVGKVIANDPEDENLPYQISFMEHGKGKGCHTFKWPGKEDSIWSQRDDILCVIQEPVSHGTRKMFKLQASDLAEITDAFEKYK